MFYKGYLNKYFVDVEFEFFVAAWEKYHIAANKIDGHIKTPRNLEERKLIGLAIKEGIEAQTRYLGFYITSDLKKNKKWQSAKLEALRRLKAYE